MCDIDLKTCEKSSKYKKKDIVDLGKKCGVNPNLPNGREKTRQVICTEIVNQYSANPSSSSSESDDDEGQKLKNNNDPICGISEKKCNGLEKVDLLALGEYCGVDVYTAKGNLKSSKTICRSVSQKHGSPSPKKSPLKNNHDQIKNMDVSSLKKLAKKLDIDWKKKDIKELQYLITKKLNSMRSVSPSPKSPSPQRSRSPGIQNMKKKELKALVKALGVSDKKLEKMDKNDLIQYILSRKKSPSPSMSPVRQRSPSPVRKSRSRTPKRRSASPSPIRSKYRAADLLGKKVAELKEMAKVEGLKKWKDKTPSKMLKQDLVDFLLHVGGGGQVPKTPSLVQPSISPKGRAELALLKVPELKALALSYGLKKFKDKTPSQLRKNDFIDFIVSTQKQKSRSPSPRRSRSRSVSPPKYKSKELGSTSDDSGDEIVVKKTVKKPSPKKRSKTPPASVRRSRTPSLPPSVRPISSSILAEDEEEAPPKRTPPASVRRSRTPSVRPKSPSVRPPSPSPSVRPKSPSVRPPSPPPSIRPKSPSVRPPSVRPKSPSVRPSITVAPPSSVKSRPDLPKYTGKHADRDLEILAHEHNFESVPVKGDGNCLFRAISKSLRLNQNMRYTHEMLRAMVVEYLKDHPDFLETYLEYVTESGETTPEEYAKNAKRYIQAMSKSGTWGDFICLMVLSELLKVQFNLLILNTRNFQLISNNDAYTTIVPLGFIDDYHYTALVPLKRVPPLLASKPPPSIMVPSASIRPSSIRPSIVSQPSIAPSIKPSIRPSVVPMPSMEPSIAVPISDIAPKIPPPVFGKVKPLSSVNELLELMDKVKPYVYDDIFQLQKAERQIMVSLGM
jgi:hypothetical protein